MSRPITSKKIKSKRRRDSKINLISLQNIRRYVVSWIVVVVMIVVIQLMVLFDVIHVVNKKSPEASDKSFLYTALEVFCLGESFRRIFKSNFRWESSGLHLVCEHLSTELNYRHPPTPFCAWWRFPMIHLSDSIVLEDGLGSPVFGIHDEWLGPKFFGFSFITRNKCLTCAQVKIESRGRNLWKEIFPQSHAADDAVARESFLSSGDKAEAITNLPSSGNH